MGATCNPHSKEGKKMQVCVILNSVEWPELLWTVADNLRLSMHITGKDEKSNSKRYMCYNVDSITI